MIEIEIDEGEFCVCDKPEPVDDDEPWIHPHCGNCGLLL